MNFTLDQQASATLLRLTSPECDDATNRLTRARVVALTEAVAELASQSEARPLVITGNHRFFSAGADLDEITALTGPAAYEFAAMGQRLMNTISTFPAGKYAGGEGFFMGGGLGLTLACRHRGGGPHAVFWHRGAGFGVI